MLDLDGRDDHVRLPAFAFTNLHQATIEAWVKWRSFNGFGRIIDFGERGPGSEWGWGSTFIVTLPAVVESDKLTETR